MQCVGPLKGYRHDDGVIRFRRPVAGDASLAVVRCGQCIGCRMSRSQEWAARCMHENITHGEVGQFITLTYNDDYLPKTRSLVKSDFQKFMKRLRFRKGAGLRFFMCGEYGGRLGRPHYHMLLFNYPFEDLVKWKDTDFGPLYQSADLLSSWRLGNCVLGALTLTSACYVSSYLLKKVTGPNAEAHYQGRLPEYNDMSRRPGIGREWWFKYAKQEYDYVVVDGRKLSTPRYYDKLMEWEFPETLEKFKRFRLEKSGEEASYRRLMQVEEKHLLDVARKEREKYVESLRDL